MKIIEIKHFDLMVRLFTVLKKKQEVDFTPESMSAVIRLHFPEYRKADLQTLEEDCKDILARL